MATLEKNLTAFLDEIADRYQLPGYDCSVYHHHEEVYRHQRGFADVENGMSISAQTLYHIYSNTKVIACVAALQLYERGLFRLDDELSKFFPVFCNVQVQDADGTCPAPKRPILLRDLFTMTAGIGDGSDLQELGMQFYIDTNGACPISALPDYLAKVPLLFDPGEGYQYGICHEVLAALIEKLSGEEFGAYLSKHIFAPLCMHNTAFDAACCPSTEMAVQYSYQGEGVPPKNEGTNNILIPPIIRKSASGGLISTVDDYMKFQEALCTGETLLHRDTIDLMRRNHLCGLQWSGYGYTKYGLGYGLGVRTVRDDKNPQAVGAFGWGGAAGTLGLIDPENELTAFYAQQMFGTKDMQGCGEFAQMIYKNL